MTKVVLITGASTGFGHLAAKLLLAKGDVRVHALSRNFGAMKELEDRGAIIHEADVRSTEQVEAVTDAVIAKEGRIDGVLANAGYGEYGMIEAVSMEGIQNQFDVNVFGVARTLKAVLPHMRRQGSGRVVITESIVSHISTLGLGWYASTKHALRAMSIALRQEVRDMGIQVVAIEPGAIDTNFAPVAFERLQANRVIDDYADLSDAFRLYMEDSYSKAPTPDSTGEAMVEALLSDNPKTIYKTTVDAKFGPTIIGMARDKTYDNLILSQVRKALEKNKNAD